MLDQQIHLALKNMLHQKYICSSKSRFCINRVICLSRIMFVHQQIQLVILSCIRKRTYGSNNLFNKQKPITKPNLHQRIGFASKKITHSNMDVASKKVQDQMCPSIIICAYQTKQFYTYILHQPICLLIGNSHDSIKKRFCTTSIMNQNMHTQKPRLHQQVYLS